MRTQQGPGRPLRGSPPAIAAPERFLDCVHCGLCLQACPTYVELGTETDSPRGRIYLMRAAQNGALALSADVVRHLDLCLGCRACETACPSGVHYGELIEGARVAVEAAYRRPFRQRLQRRIVTALFPHPARLRAVLWPIRLLGRAGVLPTLRRLVPLAAMLPALDDWSPLAEEVRPRGPAQGRVGLLAGCVAQVLCPGTNRATVRVLTRNGYAVTTPRRQTCCGALYLHAGDRDAALGCARRNIDAFPEAVSAVVVNAAGCGAMLKQYGELLADDRRYADRARAFSARVRDVTEFLAERALVPPSRRLPQRVTYHDACHLAHGQGVRAAPRALLAAIPGLELVELPESDVCCGSAGSYNLTEPEMAARLGARKAECIRASGAVCVAAANPGCILQIQGALRRAGLSVDVRHPIELLDAAYDGDV